MGNLGTCSIRSGSLPVTSENSPDGSRGQVAESEDGISYSGSTQTLSETIDQFPR